MVTVSTAPLETLQAFKERMGWTFKWVSCDGNDFNRDYHVSFTEEDKARGTVRYNFRDAGFTSPELPGISVFLKDEDGSVYHTYSAYARGLDTLMGTYQLLDLVPNGRDEDGLPYPMAWVKFRDQY
jgi:predicted dithiol-disulfide oxidoreductase (DUF899 family)